MKKARPALRATSSYGDGSGWESTVEGSKFSEAKLGVRLAVAGVSGSSHLRSTGRRNEPSNPNIEPRRVLSSALRNDVFYPTYISVKGGPPDPQFKASWDSNDKLYYQYLVAHTIWLNESRNLLRIFDENRITTLPMKGLHLAQTYYPDTLMRFSLDADFLFESKKDKLMADRLLTSKGFRLDYEAPFETNWTKRISRFSFHCETHLSPGSITYSFEYPASWDAWSSSKIGSIGGYKVHLMGAEHVLLVLCTNMAYKGVFSVRDFLDLRQILAASKSFDWNFIEFMSQIAIWRYIVLIPLYLAQLLASSCLQESLVPERTLKQLAKGADLGTTNELLHRMATVIQREGLPIHYRNIFTWTEYMRTPFSMSFFLWAGGKEPSLRTRILRVILEAFTILIFVRVDYGSRHAVSCLRSWFSTYAAKFRVGVWVKRN
jgi:Uncharacterised nucleotidyltransferase